MKITINSEWKELLTCENDCAIVVFDLLKPNMVKSLDSTNTNKIDVVYEMVNGMYLTFYKDLKIMIPIGSYVLVTL